MHSADKPVNRMDRLVDMAHFPAAVNAGATANVLLTLVAVWFLVPHLPQASSLFYFTGMVLCFNLLPVVLLRRTIRRATPFPPLGVMSFVRDQHKFPPGVYAVASGNMAFWILLGWVAFSVRHRPLTLAGVLLLAFLCTFAPVLWRRGQP